MVAKREVALLTELDGIQADVVAKIKERRLRNEEQLTRHRDDTERELMTNILNVLLHKQLDNIKEEMEKILVEQILFSSLSISCQMKQIERTIYDNFCVLKTFNPYTFRTIPLWHKVKEGREEDQLYNPSAICIDPTSHLIYVGEYFTTERIQVFSSEGRYHSTLRNSLLNFCRYINIHQDYIYVSTSSAKFSFLKKLNKKGETIKSLTRETPVRGLR